MSISLAERRFLTIAEAADFLGVSRALMYENAKPGSGLKVIRIGAARAWRIEIVDLEQWIEQRKNPGPAQVTPDPIPAAPSTGGDRGSRRRGRRRKASLEIAADAPL